MQYDLDISGVARISKDQWSVRALHDIIKVCVTVYHNPSERRRLTTEVHDAVSSCSLTGWRHTSLLEMVSKAKAAETWDL